MRTARFSVIVIGASAGGLEALTTLLPSLPADFRAAVFVVQRMAAHVTGHVLVRALAQKCSLPCALARAGERIAAGRIYVASGS